MSAGSSVLVTGASGFIGSHLTRRLLAEGFPVVATYRNPEQLYRLEAVQRRVVLARVDLLDREAVEALFHAHRFRWVVHCAAHGVRAEWGSGNEVVDMNVGATVTLATLAAQAEVERFVYIGSGFEYEPRACPIAEDAPLRPVNLYGAAKAAGWVVLDCLQRIHGLPLVTVRPFSVYGPGEHPRKFVPHVITAALRRESIPLTHGYQVRDYVFVEDVVEAIILAIRQWGGVGRVYNVGAGPQGAMSIRVLAETVVRLCGASENLIRYGEVESKRPEPLVLVADPTRASVELGWRPRVSLDEGLRVTIEWYQKHIDMQE